MGICGKTWSGALSCLSFVVVNWIELFWDCGKTRLDWTLRLWYNLSHAHTHTLYTNIAVCLNNKTIEHWTELWSICFLQCLFLVTCIQFAATCYLLCFVWFDWAFFLCYNYYLSDYFVLFDNFLIIMTILANITQKNLIVESNNNAEWSPSDQIITIWQ